LDTKGNIFGGFTPVEWESRVHNGKYGDEDNRYKADDSLKSFLFTLKNPRNVPARRFALNPKMKHRAIRCDSESDPNLCDIGIFDNCNANTNSFAFFGGCQVSYINDIGVDGKTVFTGSLVFQVKEIEVFEIIN
jgi:hypothetical protein